MSGMHPQGKLILSFGVATFIAALASVWLLADVRRRVDALERDGSRERGAVARERGAPATPAPAPDPVRPADGPRPPAPDSNDPDDADDPLASRDTLVKLDYLIRKADKASDEAYEYYNDVASDLMALKREVRQLKATVRNLGEAVQRGRPGGTTLAWGLAPKGAPLDQAVAKSYREEAERFGMVVEDGRVVARGVLNLSPRKSMPIEYFVTRFPESGHETLVHLIGAHTVEQLATDHGMGLRGLGTALYKALVAAGFREGEGTRRDPASSDREPRWLPPHGDPVYLYVRYELAGRRHLARATDWVLDPATGTVLPEGSFLFTGSVRGEDSDTGDEVLAAEMSGLLVSVWPSEASLLEVGLESAARNDFQYNFPRIPKPDGEGPFLLELVFSKTPLPPEGDGAAPIPPPAPPVPGDPAPGVPAVPLPDVPVPDAPAPVPDLPAPVPGDAPRAPR